MNDQQRAAMQMALRDLELIWEDNRPSITALREALAQPQGEWVDLTDDEIEEVCVGLWAGYWSYSRWIPLAQTFIAKFKEKNTPPVVPQEPVAWSDAALLSLMNSVGDGPYGEEDIAVTRRFMEYAEQIRPELITTPPSVEAAIEATKEKAAKVLGEVSLTQDELQSIESACSTSTECYRVVAKALKDKHAAAIRSMK
jgi:hypothetical protein